MSRITALFGAFFISMSANGMELLAIPAGRMHCAPEEVEIIPPAHVKEENIRNGFYATLRPIIGATEVNRAVGGVVMSFPASNKALYNYRKKVKKADPNQIIIHPASNKALYNYRKKVKKADPNQIIIHTEVLASSNDANKDLEKSFWQVTSKSQKDFDTRTNWGNASNIDIEKELAVERSTMNQEQANILREFMRTLPPRPKNKHSILLSKIQRFLVPYNPVERLRLEALARRVNTGVHYHYERPKAEKGFMLWPCN